MEKPPWHENGDFDRPITSRALQVADEIFAGIADGRFALGTRLPAERVFAEKHGVTRTTVRQALSLLEHHCIVVRRPGSGSIVCYKANEQTSKDGVSKLLDLVELSQITTPLELGVVRSIVEPEIIRLAVINMNTRDIERLRDIMQRMEKVTVDGEAFSKLDDEFRMLLAEGARNPLLLAIYHIIDQVGRTAGWSILRRQRLSPRSIRNFALQNKSICTAIENRDIDAAVENLKLSLADFHKDLVGGS